MQYSGILTKMATELLSEVQYYLVFKNDFIHLNTLLNQTINMELIGHQCVSCGQEKTLYRQGFCYSCFYSSPQSGDWIFRPELSKAHLNIVDRDLEYEKKVQLQPHVVYLSFTGDIKVGMTRKSQIPYRWIDQGATQAFPIIEVPNRYLAGITEVALKEIYPDKTNWRKMLADVKANIHWTKEFEKIKNYIPKEATEYLTPTALSTTEIKYPVLEYPTKINSINLDKLTTFKGVLKGIKGQYLIFEGGFVMNVRNHEGCKVKLMF